MHQLQLSEKFRNKYRISSTRLQSWDYASAGMYFITICTKNRDHYFGEIVAGKMILSTIGETAQTEWLKTPEIRPDMNLKLGEFVVMPNHFHAVLIIGKNIYNSVGVSDGNGGDAMHQVSGDAMHQVSGDAMHQVSGDAMHQVSGDAMHQVSRDAMHQVSRDAMHRVSQNQFAPQSKNLASVIRGYKSTVTTFARKNGISFDWQTRFHEHVIRSAAAHSRISIYIANNPFNWKEDKFHVK